jgi:hypothetical protein
MLYRLRRHPWAAVAHFDWSLAIVWAVPRGVIEGLLPPGLTPDLFGEYGFVAAALVQTRALRPTWAPRFAATDFFLAGYRAFVRSTAKDGRNLRGLYILGGETDSRRMTWIGRCLTHYGYTLRRVETGRSDESLEVKVSSLTGEVVVDVTANLQPASAPPAGSPFPDLRTARRFAGPMPFTLSYEAETRSILAVEGDRQHWEPRPVSVEIRRVAFFERPPFAATGLPVLANAFYVSNVDYHWQRGTRHPLPAAA